MRPFVALALVAFGLADTSCAHRRCDSWSGAPCRASGEPAARSTLRIYAIGDAGKGSAERAQALSLLAKVVAAEDGPADRALVVLGNNVYERGMLSADPDVASAKEFYGKLFGALSWKTVAVVPGNYDHGSFRHGGYDEKAVDAEARWFHDLRADVKFPPAADPHVEQPWLSFGIPGRESCVAFAATDSQGYRENLLALPMPVADAAWNVALAHHPTRTAANHMGDRTHDDYVTYARSLEGADLLLAGHENVLFADLEPRDAGHPGPPNVVSGSFSRVARLKSPEATRCGSEQPGFVRLSVVGDALVVDFFSFMPGEPGDAKPYCTQKLEKAGSGAKCPAP